MPEQTARLRYFDGEYLRSFDFEAEQDYHVHMRRRLNMALHPWGIVEGLDIVADVEGTVTTFSIAPGIAIDAFGREIIVFNPYQLDASVLANSLIKTPGTYQLMIRYKLDPTTPPSGGYGQCNGGNQSTRWLEHFEVRVVDQTFNFPATEPNPTEALSENPKIDGWMIPLAIVTVGFGPDGITPIITAASNANRKYIGLRTQRILSPADATTATPPFDIKKAQTPTDPPASVEVDANFFALQNLIVGQNFDITLGGGAPSPAATGNLKVAGDLLLQGRMFVNDAGTWTALQKFVDSLQAGLKAQLPQFRVGTFDIVITKNAAADVSTGSTSPALPIPTDFNPGTYSVAVSASITGVLYRSKTDVDTVRALLGAGDINDQFKVTPNAAITATGCDLTFTWDIRPVKQIGGAFLSTIDTLTVSYVVIFTKN